MCGISGIYDLHDSSSLEQRIEKSLEAIQHRGPDGRGHCEVDPGLMFGHVRLAIQDLSPSGAQPMSSKNLEHSLIFNGEIYNFLEIRKELEQKGVTFRGHSDTEVLFQALIHWGAEKSLQRIRGMFAFAFWIKKEEKLILARDPVGEKPLYWGWNADQFYFASELKAFFADPHFKKEIDLEALSLFLKYNVVPSPYSILKGISKLEPGHFLDVSLKTKTIKDHIYWDPSESLESFQGTSEEARNQFQSLLRQVVSEQMISDVPLGAFLSGGYDSSLIAAVMQEQQSPVKTFSIGFEEAAFDESPHAQLVADHLGTQHSQMILKGSDSLQLIPRLSEIYDEPFADSSQLPTILLSKMTRSEVTVSLSGDGGDEVFGGYVRYEIGKNLWNKMSTVPFAARKAASLSLNPFSTPFLAKALRPLLFLLSRNHQFAQLENKVEKFRLLLRAQNFFEFYDLLVSSWPRSPMVKTTQQFNPKLKGLNDKATSIEEQMMLFDLQTYLPDDILTKVDRATMSQSLESRSPLLDRRIIDFSLTLPLDYKIQNGQGKLILKELCHQYIPKALMERPKMGFGVPLGHWLRTDLKDWAQDLLSQEALQKHPYLDSKRIAAHFEKHQIGETDESARLWPILMFREWYERWM